MLVSVEIIHSYIYKKKLYSISRQGEACKDKIDAGKTPNSVSMREVWLRAVLVTFGVSRKFNSLTPRSVSLHWAWHHAVLVCAESNSAQC